MKGKIIYKVIMSEQPSSMRAKGQAPDAKLQGPATPEVGKVVNNTPLPKRILEGARWLITGAPTTGMQLEDLGKQLADLTAQRDQITTYAAHGGMSDSYHSGDNRKEQNLTTQIDQVRAQIKKLSG